MTEKSVQLSPEEFQALLDRLDLPAKSNSNLIQFMRTPSVLETGEVDRILAQLATPPDLVQGT